MILICGASGLVGKEMCNLLEKQHINYIGTYNKNKINKDNMFQIDFSNPNQAKVTLPSHYLGASKK